MQGIPPIKHVVSDLLYFTLPFLVFFAYGASINPTVEREQGFSKMGTLSTMKAEGGKGSQNTQKSVHVVYGWPLLPF